MNDYSPQKIPQSKWLIIPLLAALSVSTSAFAEERTYTLEEFRTMLVGAHTAHLQSVQRDTPFAYEWKEWLDGVVRKSEGRIVQDVNFRFNRLRYQPDAVTWKSDEYWAAPEQFFAVGAGDCEDYAMAKYFALLELGFPRDKLALAYAFWKDQAHVVLVYFDESDPLVLDNTSKWVQRASKRKDLDIIAYIAI